MAHNFDEILAEIHKGNSDTFIADADKVLTIEPNSR
jgi:hypothetical protein